MRSSQPELAWLKDEFNLGDSEFRQIARLHAGYLPQCMERCRHIDELNDKLANILATAEEVTPEVESLMKERARMRATCQIEMLRHFFEVSRTMPPEQGRRYLAWVTENTALREEAMPHGGESTDNATEPAHHH